MLSLNVDKACYMHFHHTEKTVAPNFKLLLGGLEIKQEMPVKLSVGRPLLRQ